MTPSSKSPASLPSPISVASSYKRPRRSCRKSVSIAPDVSIKTIDQLVKLIQVGTDKLNDVHLEEVMAEEGEFVSGVHEMQGRDRGSFVANNVSFKNKRNDTNSTTGTRRSSRRHVPPCPYSPSQQSPAKSTNGKNDDRNKPNKNIRRLELSPENIDQASALLGVTSKTLRKWYNMYHRAKSKGFDFDTHGKDFIKDHANVFFKPEKIKITEGGHTVLDGWSEIVGEKILDVVKLEGNGSERQWSAKRRKKDSSAMAKGEKSSIFDDSNGRTEPTEIKQLPSGKRRPRGNRRTSQSESEPKLLKAIQTSELTTPKAETQKNQHILSNLRPNSRIFVKWQADGSLYKATVKKVKLEKNPIMLKVHYDGKKSHIVNDVNVELVEGFIDEDQNDRSFRHEHSNAISETKTKRRKRKRKKRGKEKEIGASNKASEKSGEMHKSEFLNEVNATNLSVPQCRGANLKTEQPTEAETKIKHNMTTVIGEPMKTSPSNPTLNMASEKNSHLVAKGSTPVLPSSGSLPVTTAKDPNVAAAAGPSSVADVISSPNVQFPKHRALVFLPPGKKEHCEPAPYLGTGWMVHMKTRKRRESANININPNSGDHEDGLASGETRKKLSKRIDRFFVSPSGKRCRSITEAQKFLSNGEGACTNSDIVKRTSIQEGNCEIHANDSKGKVRSIDNQLAHNSNYTDRVHQAGIAKHEVTKSDGKETDNLQHATAEIKGTPPNSQSIGYSDVGTAPAVKTAQQSLTKGSHTDCKSSDPRQVRKDMIPLAHSTAEVNEEVSTGSLKSAKKDSITSSAANDNEPSPTPNKNERNETAVAEQDSSFDRNMNPPIHAANNGTECRESTPDSLNTKNGSVSKSDDEPMGWTRKGIDSLDSIDRNVTAHDSVAICCVGRSGTKERYNSLIESKKGLIHDLKIDPSPDEATVLKAGAVAPHNGSLKGTSVKSNPSVSVTNQSDSFSEIDASNHFQRNGSPRGCFPLNDVTKGLEIIENAMSGSTLPFSSTNSVIETRSRPRTKSASQAVATLSIGSADPPSSPGTSAFDGAIGVATRSLSCQENAIVIDSTRATVGDSRNLPSVVANSTIDAMPMVINKDKCKLSGIPDNLKLINAVAADDATTSAGVREAVLPCQVANDASSIGAEAEKCNTPADKILLHDAANVDEPTSNDEPLDTSQDEYLRDVHSDIADGVRKNSNEAFGMSNSEPKSFFAKSHIDVAVSGEMSSAETLTKSNNDPSTSYDQCVKEDVAEASGPEDLIAMVGERQDSRDGPANVNIAPKQASDETNSKNSLCATATTTASVEDPVQRNFANEFGTIENNDSVAITAFLDVCSEKDCSHRGDPSALNEAVDAHKATNDDKPIETSGDRTIDDPKDPCVTDALEHSTSNPEPTSTSGPPDADTTTLANGSLTKSRVDRSLNDHYSLVKDAIEASGSVSVSATNVTVNSSPVLIDERGSLPSDKSTPSSAPIEATKENMRTTEVEHSKAFIAGSLVNNLVEGTICGEVGDEILSEFAVSSDKVAHCDANNNEHSQRDVTVSRDLLVLESKPQLTSSSLKHCADSYCSTPSSRSYQSIVDRYAKITTDALVNESERPRSIESNEKRNPIASAAINDESNTADCYDPESMTNPVERNISNELGKVEIDNGLLLGGRSSPSCAANAAIPVDADKDSTIYRETEHDNIPGVQTPADRAVDADADNSNNVRRDNSAVENIRTKNFLGGVNITEDILDKSKPKSNSKTPFFVQSHAGVVVPATGTFTNNIASSSDLSVAKYSLEATNSDLNDAITFAAKAGSSAAPVDESESLPSDATQVKCDPSITAITTDDTTFAATNVVFDRNEVSLVERDDATTRERKNSPPFRRRRSSRIADAITTIDTSCGAVRAVNVTNALESSVQVLNAYVTENDGKPKIVLAGGNIPEKGSSECLEKAENILENTNSTSLLQDSEMSACLTKSNADCGEQAGSLKKSTSYRLSNSDQSRVQDVIKSNAVGTGEDSSAAALKENRSYPSVVAKPKLNPITATIKFSHGFTDEKDEEKRFIQVEKNLEAEKNKTVACTEFGGWTSAPSRVKKVPATVERVNGITVCEEAENLTLETVSRPANAAVDAAAPTSDQEAKGILPVRPENPFATEVVLGRSSSKFDLSGCLSTKSLKLRKADCAEPAKQIFKEGSSCLSSSSDHCEKGEVKNGKRFAIPAGSHSSASLVEKDKTSLSDIVKSESDEMALTINIATTAKDGTSEGTALFPFHQKLGTEVGTAEVVANCAEGTTLRSHIADFVELDNAEKVCTSIVEAGPDQIHEVKESAGEDVPADVTRSRNQSITTSGGDFMSITNSREVKVSKLRCPRDVSCENPAAKLITSTTMPSIRSDAMSRGSSLQVLDPTQSGVGVVRLLSQELRTKESVSGEYASFHRSNGTLKSCGGSPAQLGDNFKPFVARNHQAQLSSIIENGTNVIIHSFNDNDTTGQSSTAIGAAHVPIPKEANEAGPIPRLIEDVAENSKSSIPLSNSISISESHSAQIPSELKPKVKIFNEKKVSSTERTTHTNKVGGGVTELAHICSPPQLQAVMNGEKIRLDKNNTDESIRSNQTERVDENDSYRLNVNDQQLQQDKNPVNESMGSADMKESNTRDSSTTCMKSNESFSKGIDSGILSGEEKMHNAHEWEPGAATNHSQEIQSCAAADLGQNINDFPNQGIESNMTTAEILPPDSKHQMATKGTKLDSIVAINENETSFSKERLHSLEVTHAKSCAKAVQISQECFEASDRVARERSNPEHSFSSAKDFDEGKLKLQLRLIPLANEAVAEKEQNATSFVDVTDADGRSDENFNEHVGDCDTKGETGSTDNSQGEKEQGSLCRSNGKKCDAPSKDPGDFAFASKCVDTHDINDKTKCKVVDDHLSHVRVNNDIMSNASLKSSDEVKFNQPSHFCILDDRDSTGGSVSAINGSIDTKSVALSDTARLSDVEDKNLCNLATSQQMKCIPNPANTFSTYKTFGTSGNSPDELDETKTNAKPPKEGPDELLDEDLLFVSSIVPRGIEDIRNDTMDDEVHEALTGLEGLFDQSDSESNVGGGYDFSTCDQVAIEASPEGIDAVAAARYDVTAEKSILPAGDTEIESSTQQNIMSMERSQFGHNVKGSGFVMKSAHDMNETYHKNGVETMISNLSQHSNIPSNSNPGVSSTASAEATTTQFSEIRNHNARTQPQVQNLEESSIPQQESAIVDNLPKSDRTFRGHNEEMLHGTRQIGSESESINSSTKTYLLPVSGDVSVAGKVANFHQRTREALDESLNTSADSNLLPTSKSEYDVRVSQSEETGRLQNSALTKAPSKVPPATFETTTVKSKPSDYNDVLHGDTTMSPKKDGQLATTDPTTADSTVQLFAFDYDVSPKSAIRARPKRKLKSAARFEPFSSVFVDSCKTGQGFACPRCSAVCPYDSRVCGTCSLECCYEAGVGVITLKDRSNVSSEGSEVAHTRNILGQRQNHAKSPTSQSISNVEERAPEQKQRREIKHKHTTTKEPQSRILLCNCPSCDRNFTTQGLYAHFARAHEGKLDWAKVTYTCPFCTSNRNKFFVSRDAAQEHVTDIHPGCFLLQTHISIASKTKSPTFSANATRVLPLTQNQIRHRTPEKRSTRSSSLNFKTKSTLSQPVSSNLASLTSSKTKEALDQNILPEITSQDSPLWTHLEFTQLLPDTKKTYPRCLSKVIEMVDEKCREQEEKTEVARDQRFKLCKDAAELDLRLQDEERLTYQRGVRERTRLADAERIEKQKFTEEAQQMIMRYEYENRNRKRNKTEIEFDKLCSRPIFFSRTKIRKSSQAGNKCRNTDCQFCREDNSFLAQILLKNELDNFNQDGNSIESPVFTHSTTVLNPSYQEILSDEYFIEAEKKSESADASALGGNLAPTIKGSRRDVTTAKRLRIEEEKLRKMNDTKHNLEFIEKYNKGLIKCAWGESKTTKKKR